MSLQDIDPQNKVVRIAAVPDDGTRLLTLTDDDGTLPTGENSSEAGHHHDSSSPWSSCSQRWSEFILTIHRPTMAILKATSGVSARNPKLTIAVMTLISLGLVTTGWFTNFFFNTETETLWTPSNSVAMQHYDWIQQESGFAAPPRYFAMLFHESGANVLNRNAAQHAFAALDVLRSHDEYDAVCANGDFVVDGTRQCLVVGMTRLWSNSATEFARKVDSDDDIGRAVAETFFPDGLNVPHDRIYGSLERNQTFASYAQAFIVTVALPDAYEGIKEIELEMIDDLLELQKSWQEQGDTVVMEVAAHGSIPAELIRAVNEDLPLIPLVFVMMSLFTSAVFAKRNPVYSRSGLGLSAVVAVMLSILAGFGLMFIIGVPFTSITQLIPFLVFGIGLDDAFIVVGSYIRTDPMKDPVKRIEETIEDIGLSITLTTLTTATAFGLGCSSSVPAVYWLCQYCFPTIFFVLLYQLTFFVACIVLDERRIQARRRDLLICVKVPPTLFDAPQMRGHFTDRLMEAYAKVLLHPFVRFLVFVGFTGLLVASTFSFLELEQNFKIQDIIPRVSYVRDYLDADSVYFNNTGGFSAEIYFRDVDQSNATVRTQMKEYVAAIQDLEFVNPIPSTSIWMSLFDLNLAIIYPNLINEPFSKQVEAFLAPEINQNGFAPNLVLDDEGNIIASKIPININADLSDVHAQIKVLVDERELTFSTEINQGRGDDLAFFTFADIYTVFEFYLVCLDELIWTTIYGVASVSAVAMLFIPHISAVFFVFPMICVLYVDLLGVIQWSGLYINAMTYLGLTMSIGLMVDFIMHVLFRYYEVPGNRVQKTTEMLKTMGASILLGGLTTFLGTIPLYFTSSNAFRTIFTVFVGIVSLGVGHGLILMPVVLATFGPETQVTMSYRGKESNTSGADYKTASAVRSAAGFGELEHDILHFQNLVASANADKEKRFEEILSFVVNYAHSVGVDPEVVLQEHPVWGSADGEASTDGEVSVASGKKEAFSEALMDLFHFAKTNGLDPEAALKKRKAATQFRLQNTDIRAKTAITYPDFENDGSQSEDEC